VIAARFSGVIAARAYGIVLAGIVLAGIVLAEIVDNKMCKKHTQFRGTAVVPIYADRL